MRQTEYNWLYFMQNQQHAPAVHRLSPSLTTPPNQHEHEDDENYETNNNNDDDDDSPDDIWLQVKHRMQVGLELSESVRRFCAYCGLKEVERSGLIMGRCYGCQLTYYCSQEHQHLDWLEAHMPKCAQLEWVSLCELVQATHIVVPLPGAAQYWTTSSATSVVATWTDWFEMRSDLVRCAHLVAESMQQNLISQAHFSNTLNRREPSLGI